jgi:hypothetical protein
VAPAGKEAALGWVTGAGALVSLIANPLFGALSTGPLRASWRRHPWTSRRALVGAVALVMLGRQARCSGVTLGGAWCRWR